MLLCEIAEEATLQLLQTLLPVLGLVVVAAQGIAHAIIQLKHKPDHALLIDSIANAVRTVNNVANPSSPPLNANAPDAGGTP